MQETPRNSDLQVSLAKDDASQAVLYTGSQTNTFNIYGDKTHSALPPIPSLYPPLTLLRRTHIAGRDDLIGQLVASLSPTLEAEARVIVLHGIAGGGKTTVALSLADEALQRGQDVWWVPASDSRILTSALRAVALAAGAEPEAFDRANAADILWKFLNERQNRWLLVLDNADDPSQILGSQTSESQAAYSWLRVPNANGLVLVTTRDGDPETWDWIARRIPVPALTPQDGAEILLRTAPDAGNRADAVTLAERLCGLPLELQIAGAALRHARSMPPSWISADEIPATFADYALALEPSLVGATWELSLRQLEAQGCPDAPPLLRFLACFADCPIPIEPLINASNLRSIEPLKTIDAARLWHVLNRLKSFSLIDVTGDSRPTRSGAQVVLHPLVRETARSHRYVAENIDSLCTALSLSLNRATEKLDAHETPTWELWGELAAHCTSALDLRIETGTLNVTSSEELVSVARAATYWIEIGLPSQISESLAVALDIQQRLTGPSGPETLRLRFLHATMLRELGFRNQAVTEYETLLDDQLALYGAKDPRALATRNRLGRCLREVGRLDEAEREIRFTLEARAEVLGTEDLDTLISRRGLALILEDRASYTDALAEYDVVIQIQDRILGPSHPDTLGTRHNRARVLQMSGKLSQASTELEAIVASRGEILGQRHRLTMEARHTLAFVRQEMGFLSEAEEEYRSILQYQDDVMGTRHPASLATRANLARVLQELGRYQASRDEYESVLPVQIEVLGDDNVNTLSTRHGLAFVIMALGDPVHAERELRDVVIRQSKLLGPDHPDCLTARANLARSLQEQGRLAEAVVEYRSLVAPMVQTLGEGHPLVLSARHGYAYALHGVREFDLSESEYSRVIDLQCKILGAGHSDVLGTRHNFARLLQDIGALPRAEAELRSVLLGRISVLGESHPETLGTRHALAYLLGLRAKVSEATREYNILISLLDQTLGPDNPATLGARHDLSALLGGN